MIDDDNDYDDDGYYFDNLNVIVNIIGQMNECLRVLHGDGGWLKHDDDDDVGLSW